jgi:hypothetical protein
LKYFYYKKGSREVTDQPYVCESLTLEDQVKKLDTRNKCVHEYIKILSTAINKERKDEGAKLYRKLCRQDNLGWLLDREDARDLYERQAYGEEHFWCWKCGAYYVPTGKPSFFPPAVGWGEETS